MVYASSMDFAHLSQASLNCDQGQNLLHPGGFPSPGWHSAAIQHRSPNAAIPHHLWSRKTSVVWWPWDLVRLFLHSRSCNRNSTGTTCNLTQYQHCAMSCGYVKCANFRLVVTSTHPTNMLSKPSDFGGKFPMYCWVTSYFFWLNGFKRHVWLG